MRRRVVQWATGGVGRAAICGIAARSDLELVGCWVHSEDKAGRDAGELAGIDPLGVAATQDVDALLALEPDAIVYAPILPDADLVARMLASGANVVTPLGWFFPGARDVTAIEQACRDGGTTLHGTGIHPGGITEKFPLMVSPLSARITHVRAEEFSDIRTYDAPFVVGEVMLFGKTPDEVANSYMPALLTDGFSQSMDMVTEAIGFRVDGPPNVDHEFAVATAPIEDTPIGTIEPGQVAAQRFRWEATVDGAPVITVQVNWLMGQEHLDPAWTFGPEGERFEVEVTGDPSSKVTFHGWHPETIAVAASATLAWSPPPTTASRPSRPSWTPSRASAPTSTCPWSPAGPRPTSVGTERPVGSRRAGDLRRAGRAAQPCCPAPAYATLVAHDHEDTMPTDLLTRPDTTTLAHARDVATSAGVPAEVVDRAATPDRDVPEAVRRIYRLVISRA